MNSIKLTLYQNSPREEQDQYNTYILDYQKYGNHQCWDVGSYNCATMRDKSGFWWGYVRISDNYPIFQIEHINDWFHGGIKYYQDRTVGFACNYFGDFIPNNFFHTKGEIYRTFEDVKDEMENIIIYRLEDIKNSIFRVLDF